jgi:hypothetical protein
MSREPFTRAQHFRPRVGGQLADLLKEGEAGLAIPPEKRSLTQDGFRLHSGDELEFFRDTWLRTAGGWRRIQQ